MTNIRMNPRRLTVMLRENEMRIHRDYIHRRLSEALPSAQVGFASSVDEITEIGSIDVLITPVQPWIDEVARRAENLRWIHLLSSGVDGIWSLKFDKSKYLLSKSSGVHAVPITEYVIGSILYFLKGFHVFLRQQRNREWQRRWLDEATEKTVGILGLGAIGQEVARRCKAMGMRVLGMATSVRSVSDVDVVFDLDGLPDILTQADFVVVCLPLTAQTRGLLSRETLGLIRPSAYLINVSRGSVVDEEALTTCLKSGRLAGAALDVFETEPLDQLSPLWDLDNVIVTPHVSGTTPYYMERAIAVFLENHEALIRTGTLSTPVDIRSGY